MGAERGSGLRSRASACPGACRVAARILVPLVLLGLWMMHGMSATMESGCHGMGMPMPVAAAMADAHPAVAAESSVAGRGGAVSVQSADTAMTGSGELCLSGQPPTPGAALLMLLALLALAGWAVVGASTGPRRLVRSTSLRWRAPPGTGGIDLLTVVCVSRT
jgi:hypothetical protein